MNKAYNTVKIHKLTLTNIPNIIIKFIANYSVKKDKHVLNTTAHFQTLNKSSLEYRKVEFCLKHYLTFIPDIPLPQKMHESQHMPMT